MIFSATLKTSFILDTFRHSSVWASGEPFVLRLASKAEGVQLQPKLPRSVQRGVTHAWSLFLF